MEGEDLIKMFLRKKEEGRLVVSSERREMHVQVLLELIAPAGLYKKRAAAPF